MARFNIPRQQTTISGARASANSFGGGALAFVDDGRGAVAIGKAVQNIGSMVEQKRLRDEKVRLQKDLSRATTDWTQRQIDLEQEYQSGDGLVDAFDNEFQGYAQTFLNAYEGDSRDEAELRLINLQDNMKRKLIGRQAQLKSQQEVADFESSRDILVNQVANDQIEGDFALSVLTGHTQALTLLNPKIRGDIQQQNEDLIGESEFNRILKNEGVMTTHEVLRDGYFDRLSPNVRESLDRKLTSRAQVHVRNELSNAVDKYNAGYPVDDLSLEIEMAETFGLTEQKAQMQTMQKLQAEVNEFVKKPLSDNSQIIRDLDKKLLAGEGSATDLERLSVYNSALQIKAKMLEENPYEWLQRSNWFDGDILPADVSGDMTLALNQRRSIQNDVFEREGVAIPLFTNQEANQIITTLDSASPENKAATLAKIVAQLEPQEVGRVAAQVGPKAPELGAAMVNAEFAPETSRDILIGRTRDVVTPSDNDFSTAFLSNAGVAIEDEVARNQALSAIKALYKERTFRSGEATNIMDQNLFKKLSDEVLGPIISLNTGFFGSGTAKTLSFRGVSGAYLDSDDFEELIEDIDSNAFMATHGDVPRSSDNKPLNIENMFKRMDLVSVGDGTYIIKDQLGGHALNRDGSIFEIDMKALESYQVNNSRNRFSVPSVGADESGVPVDASGQRNISGIDVPPSSLLNRNSQRTLQNDILNSIPFREPQD